MQIIFLNWGGRGEFKNIDTMLLVVPILGVVQETAG